MLLTYWMYPSWKTTRGFEEPKIVSVRVDEEPFLRVPLAPGERYRPIQVMAKTQVEVVCEVVATADTRRFVLRGFGQTYEARDCTFVIPIPEEVGRSDTLLFRFYNGDTSVPTDEIEVPVVVVVEGRRLSFHAIEDEEGRPVQDVAVPQRIRVYGTAIWPLPNPKEYTALFFVTEPASGRLVLVLDPSRPDDPSPLLARLVRYRKWGRELDGIALWSPEPIQVGGPQDHRTVYDLYFGLFRKSDVATVFRKTVAVERSGEDVLRVTPLLSDVEAVRALTLDGSALSPPLHLVRGAPAAEVTAPRTTSNPDP